jgi:hypothetical protein
MTDAPKTVKIEVMRMSAERATDERETSGAAQQEKTWERLPCMGWAVGWHPWS